MGAVPMAVAAVAIVPLCNKFGKRIVCMVGMLLGAVGGVIAIMGNGQIVPVAIGVALKCLGSAPACYMILAMLADVIDHIEYKFGIRTDGLTMSIYSSIMVAATPVCNSIFSAILNASGYDQAADIALGTAAQTAAAQTAISVGYIWVETIAYVICAILIFFQCERNQDREYHGTGTHNSKSRHICEGSQCTSLFTVSCRYRNQCGVSCIVDRISHSIKQVVGNRDPYHFRCSLKRNYKHQYRGNGQSQSRQQDPRSCLSSHCSRTLNKLTYDQVCCYDQNGREQL